MMSSKSPKGLRYDNLVPDGKAELSTYNSTEGTWEYKAQYIIASKGHVDDFYRGNGYEDSGDDVNSSTHTFDSLADFMGTSQDSAGNPNGATTFFFKQDGSRLTLYDVSSWNATEKDRSGMYGIWEYVNYRGYSSETLFNQYANTYTNGTGFTFNNFMSEINAGRVVLVHIEGHTMLGYGYDTNGTIIYVHDTWNPGDHTMVWGGTYSNSTLIGVTCFTPSRSSPVPLPGAIWFLTSSLLVVIWRSTRNSFN